MMLGRPYLLLLAALGLLLSACTAPATANPAQLTFDPVAAFAGRSHGDGLLSVIFQVPQPFEVESRGFAQADGTFRLNQTVTFAGKPPQKRHWLLNRVSPGTYAGTLSDAEGSVTGHVKGPQFKLEYALPGGLTMHQTLTLERGGKTIDNIGRITFRGIEVGYLHETIRRGHALKRTQLSRNNAALVRTTSATLQRR